MFFVVLQLVHLLLACLQIGSLFASLFGVAALFRRRGLGPELSVVSALAVTGIASLLLFYVAWVSLPFRIIPDILGWLTFSGGLVLFCLAVHHKQLGDEIARPILFAALAGLILSAWVFIGADIDNPMAVGQLRWIHPLPDDNAIPLIFAQALYDGDIPHPLMREWLSSDRPPLQTGLFMLTPGYLLLGPNEFVYQPAGVGAQMLSLVAVWLMLRAFTTDQRIIYICLLCTFFSPFFILNGSFVWPKLLAASFLLSALILHFRADIFDGLGEWQRGALSGALCASAFLAHATSAFVIIGMAISALVLRKIGSRNYLAAGTLAFALLYAPWLVYQGQYPPANHLTKIHLAGTHVIDERSISDALRDAYGSISWKEYAARKYQNFVRIICDAPEVLVNTARGYAAPFTKSVAEAQHILRIDVRALQFFSTVAAGGLLGFAFFLLPAGLFNARARALTLVVITSLIVWIFLMFEPGATVVHQGSLVPLLIVVPCSLFLLAEKSRRACFIVAGLHCGLTLLQYGF